MYCPRCGTKVNENIEYCHHCGANIKEELSRYNFNPIQESTVEKGKQPTHEEQYQYSLEYSYGNKEEFIRAYVGKNYEKIKKQKFSWPSFFLGSIYCFYRKLYTLGLIWVIISWITGILNIAFLLILQIVLARYFSAIYLSTVEKRVKTIKRQNKTTSQEEILTQCTKKGGTNFILTFILIFIICIALGIISFLIYTEINKTTEYKELTKETTFEIGNITYTMPKGYELYYESEGYKAFGKFQNTYCDITIRENTYSSLYDSEEEYLQSYLYTDENDIVSPLTTITLNNEVWTQVTIQTQNDDINNIYVLKKPKAIYEIETRDDTSLACQEDYQQILNSMTYQEER